MMHSLKNGLSLNGTGHMALMVLLHCIWSVVFFSGNGFVSAASHEGNLKYHDVGSKKASTLDVTDEKVQSFNKRIQQAIEEAKKSGKKSVNIYMDEIPDTVQERDLVTVSCKAQMDGEVVSGDTPAVMEIVAGEKTRVPGLGKAVIGMKQGGYQVKTIPPEQAFGERSKDKIKIFPSTYTTPLISEISAEDYQTKFGKKPVKGALVRTTPYYKSKVMNVEGGQIKLKHLAENGYTDKASFGVTTVKVDKEGITIRLKPVKGAIFTVAKTQGVIIDVETNRFTVDFNHPLAGKTFILTLEVLSLKKASFFDDMNIPWISGHDEGQFTAMKNKKREVLFLYADWCHWCHKMFDTTFEDPRIKLLKDDFVWVRANSDKDDSLQELYKQDGFPMIVLLDEAGKVVRKISGFKDATALLPELKQMMNLKPAEADS
nr:thioredoxin family protein [uncultured Desulfobacter sp.]